VLLVKQNQGGRELARRDIKNLRSPTCVRDPLCANNDETLTAAIITEQGGKENHRERDQDCCSFCNQFT